MPSSRSTLLLAGLLLALVSGCGSSPHKAPVEERRPIPPVARAPVTPPKPALAPAPVAEPVAVRYAWADNPVCNLYATGGLPLTPFRTDDFPGVTATAK